MAYNNLKLLRNAMTNARIRAFIIPSSDCHMSEYICKADMQREYISKFTGSNGTAVVTEDKAALWTDGRYFLQASEELSKDWTLMKSGLPETPSIAKWIQTNLSSGDRVGFEGQKNSFTSIHSWRKELKKKNIELISFPGDFFSACWPDRPSYPQNKVICHPLEFSGVTSEEKIKKIRKEMEKKEAEVLVVAALDEIAWLLNIRGSDIDYNPVAISYLLLTKTDLFWFIDSKKLTEEVYEHLKPTGASVLEYNEFFSVLRSLRGKKIWADPAVSNAAIFEEIEKEDRITEHSPISIPKAIKNEVEQNGLRESCLRDAAAIVEYFSWLEIQLKQGNSITEYEGSRKLSELRSEREKYVGDSFATISSTGANGAVIHYHPMEESSSIIDPKKMYLCDSGAQYYDGTTDVTRTVHFGEPSSHEKRCFTRVLQGHVNLATTVFPKGTVGRSLDPIARLPLWQDGLEYRHGTGHGVGSFLNVHEPPTLISSAEGNRGAYFSTPFVPGMTVTIEPGYYEDGAFGIRIENDYLVTNSKTLHNFQDTPFFTFENLTWVPIQPELVDPSLLTNFQLEWLNSYNIQCREKLMPLLRNESSKDYLTRSTKAIQ